VDQLDPDRGIYRVRIARTRLAADELARAVKEFQSARRQ
jgi:hypothetical protein